MAKRITDKLVKGLEEPAKGNVITWDTEIPGFGVRVTAGEVISFILNYRNRDGRERRYTIGRYGDFTVAAAREVAKAVRREIKDGADPVGEARDKRQAPTVREAAEDFRKTYLPGLRAASRCSYERLLDKYILPAIGSLKLTAVTSDDVRRMKHRMAAKETTANRALAVTSKLFSWAIGEGRRRDGVNPVRGVSRYAESGRQRYLSQTEIARLSAVLAEHKPENSANIIRFLLLTGARSGETFKARWEEIDFARGTWTKPSAHTKQNKTHTVPLSAPALALLESVPRKGKWIFPGPDEVPVTTIKKSWATIRGKACIPDVRIHDLRHSFASMLVSGGASLPLVGAMLGHTQTITTARYAHLHDEPLREAAELVGRVVTSASVSVAAVREVKHG